jgi:hypothetical protein
MDLVGRGSWGSNLVFLQRPTQTSPRLRQIGGIKMGDTDPHERVIPYAPAFASLEYP